MTGAGDAPADPSLADLNDAFGMIAAMERADQGASVRLIRLVDGVETWEGCAGDEKQEFGFRDDASEWVADRRREARANALVRTMMAWRDRLAASLAAAEAERDAAVRQARADALEEAARALDAYNDAIVAPAFRGQLSLHGDIVRALHSRSGS